ncbi:HmuY family protein [Paraliomyxa miuraensis]|uniref:HmuY family protein n=1 Tax=Paraliomyxa miuraensis TaxID=376150 RepID=UPI00224F59EB|nr:HmuY family protein [Paraliomyxa miuraensis]MCX4241044.1 HmuY family protein [Paraliomyxa miuraensis]
MSTSTWFSSTMMVLVMTGCAPDLGETLGDGSSTTDAPAEEGGGPQVQHEDEGDGVTVSTIDATDQEQWIYLDLESREQRDPADPADSDEWDLGLRRFAIAINGGSSGTGGMEAVMLEGTTFDAVTSIPTEGWVTDAPDGDDENEDPDYALDEWYDYDFMTHVLTPKPVVYVVRTVEGNAYKVEIGGYYDEAGTSGVFTVRWAALAPG